MLRDEDLRCLGFLLLMMQDRCVSGIVQTRNLAGEGCCFKRFRIKQQNLLKDPGRKGAPT